MARSKSSPMLGFKKGAEDGLRLKNRDSIESRYYIRIDAKDEVGVLAKISSILGENDISVSTFLQKEMLDIGRAKLLFSTHKSSEDKIQNALLKLSELDVIVEKPYMIRIEDS